MGGNEKNVNGHKKKVDDKGVFMLIGAKGNMLRPFLESIKSVMFMSPFDV